MFANGDGKRPFDRNVKLVTDLVKNEVISLLQKASCVSSSASLSADKKQKIKLEDVFVALSEHTGLLSRLIAYAEARVELARFARSANVACKRSGCLKDEESGESSEENSDEEYSEPEEKDSGQNDKRKREIADDQLLSALKSAVKYVSLDFEKVRDYVDEKHQLHTKNLLEVIRDLSNEDYQAFSAARQATFQRQKFLKSSKAPNFLAWLGNPPIGENVEFVLAFVAKETVLQIVRDAVEIRNAVR
ncbi:unnamed protein product [Caenorhabditis auriculariae]|uniref:Uncharacterized protein n=1 Tax=Caenorhabditis auriculariae TaxID=2777116 RepID=A0A8S1GZC2_9PELO|nr:unnamed protein product [Caenorhabditis auriculariae]